jgi:hypothetical protein
MKLSYSDHLRVFLLLMPQERKLDRIRQLMQVDLIQQNKDFRLKNCCTVIKAKTEVGVNLWFLPLLQVERLKPDSFKNGRYIVKKEVMLGY